VVGLEVMDLEALVGEGWEAMAVGTSEAMVAVGWEAMAVGEWAELEAGVAAGLVVEEVMQEAGKADVGRAVVAWEVRS
jgi:hypothetical protein